MSRKPALTDQAAKHQHASEAANVEIVCVCDPKISTLKTDLVLSLMMPTSPFQNKGIHRLRFDLFPTWTYATSCECPKRLTMPWLRTFPCMIVPITSHLVSRAVFESSNRERNALFQILPQTFLKDIKTRYKIDSSIFLLFHSRVASSDPLWSSHAAVLMFLSLPLCCCAHRLILRNSSHLLQTSAQWRLFVCR